MSARLRHVTVALLIAVALLSAAAMLLVGGVPAHAASSYLCKGYTSCAKKGYPNAGYAAANQNMYWRMTRGHNCTNYVAFRMVQNGMVNSRPWVGSGNALNWGPANKLRVDKTPVVGAVAWWRANVKGAGSLGHVAYIQQVVSADEIVVSEDNWGGNFDWRRIKRASGWPSGFIHFKDAGVGSPRGSVNSVTSPASGKVAVRGWAFDPNLTAKYVYIRIYVGGPAGVGQRLNLNAAKISRPDVAKAYPGVGAKHGFDQTVKVNRRGVQPVYIYGLNKKKTPGQASLLDRRMVTIRS
ncbi:MAG: CHAP domain-containing protein [Propionibacteriaceae bacterium]